MDPFVYVLPVPLGTGKLRKKLGSNDGYEIVLQKGEKTAGKLFDTFENQVAAEGMLLFVTDERMHLLNLATAVHVSQSSQSGWRFAEDLKDGPVKAALLGISKLRAFLPVASAKVREDLGALLDDETKTVARFRTIVVYGPTATLSFGVTQYMRGYHKAHRDICDVLRRSGAEKAITGSEIYNRLGIDGRDYNPKPSLTLQPDMAAKKSAIKIMKTFVNIARRNETGVQQDLDTEFLHDYRVSFRKVRSVLSLFKGVFSKGQTLQLKSEFAEIMQGTNRLRDLDVYLLEKDTYFDLVPQTSHKGLSALFQYLEKERLKEQKKVVKNLKSKSYERQISQLQELLDSPKKIENGPKASLPSREFASFLILKRYGQVCTIAGKIDDDTEDEVVHELRISCKKLRYLMEFFTPLFNRKEIKSLIKSLKILQDNLGKFNDYSVQQGFLRQIVLISLPSFKKHELEVTEAIGALTAMLFRLQLKERNQVMKNFARFDSEQTRLLFTKLFQVKGESR